VLAAFTSATTHAEISLTAGGYNILHVNLSTAPGNRFTEINIVGGDPIEFWGGSAANTYKFAGIAPINFVIATEALTGGSAIFTIEYY
jgi:hypothetical protein